MTQLIGAICEKGSKIVTVSDRMVGTGDMTLTFEHEQPKAQVILKTAVVLTAGTMHEPDLIIDKTGIQIVKSVTVSKMEEIYSERENTQTRGTFDQKITELKIQTDPFKTS